VNKRVVKGALLASAVGLMFLAHPVMAQDSSGSMQQAKVKCLGANDCKGKSACKSTQNDCKGKNACKGKGFVPTSTEQECKDKGGHVENM
jgi:hypothetical protein